jgi:hypothetical protein
MIYYQTLDNEKQIPHFLSLCKFFFTLSVLILFGPLMAIINFKYYFHNSFIIYVFVFQSLLFYFIIIHKNRFLSVIKNDRSKINIKNYNIYISIVFGLLFVIIISVFIDLIF